MKSIARWSSRKVYQDASIDQPYHTSLTVAEVRELLAGLPDDAIVSLSGGSDFDEGHSMTVIFGRPATREERMVAVSHILDYRTLRASKAGMHETLEKMETEHREMQARAKRGEPINIHRLTDLEIRTTLLKLQCSGHASRLDEASAYYHAHHRTDGYL